MNNAAGIFHKVQKRSRFVVLTFLAVMVLFSQTERRSLDAFMSVSKETHRVTRAISRTDASSAAAGQLVCSPWENNTDAWWQMHPEYEPFGENDTHTCFRPLPNPQQAQFYRQIYQNQYHGLTCQHVRTRRLIQVGYAASINWIAFGLYHSLSLGQPFDTIHFREGFKWLYSAPYSDVTPAERSWAACPEQDHKCYFLPISNCHPPVASPNQPTDPLVPSVRMKERMEIDPDYEQRFIWTQQYVQRPNQLTRKHLRDLVKEEAPDMGTGPCTWIHVRRGDATSEKFPRNFYPLQEYLERGNVSTSENILLLTDDETTIDEANLLYPQYKWHYWKRSRVRGVAKTTENHFPSHDPAREVLIILAELQLAGKCQKGVHGTSNMVEMFRMAMLHHYDRHDIQLIQIDKELKFQQGDARQFVKDLEVKLEEARKKQQQQA